MSEWLFDINQGAGGWASNTRNVYKKLGGLVNPVLKAFVKKSLNRNFILKIEVVSFDKLIIILLLLSRNPNSTGKISKLLSRMSWSGFEPRYLHLCVWIYNDFVISSIKKKRIYALN